MPRRWSGLCPGSISGGIARPRTEPSLKLNAAANSAAPVASPWTVRQNVRQGLQPHRGGTVSQTRETLHTGPWGQRSGRSCSACISAPWSPHSQQCVLHSFSHPLKSGVFRSHGRIAILSVLSSSRMAASPRGKHVSAAGCQPSASARSSAGQCTSGEGGRVAHPVFITPLQFLLRGGPAGTTSTGPPPFGQREDSGAIATQSR